jgi:hypothetical protein
LASFCGAACSDVPLHRDDCPIEVGKQPHIPVIEHGGAFCDLRPRNNSVSMLVFDNVFWRILTALPKFISQLYLFVQSPIL